jgi:hypothetical protein
MLMLARSRRALRDVRRDDLVVSAAFREALYRDIRILRWFDPLRDLATLQSRATDIAELLADVSTFSHTTVSLDDDSEPIRATILETRGPIGEIVADEWAFLQSNSWLVARTRRVIDRFIRAGASLIYHPRETLLRGLAEEVIPPGHIPAVLTPTFLAKVGVKWVAVGSAHLGAEFLFGPGVIAAFGAHVMASRIVRVFDP